MYECFGFSKLLALVEQRITDKITMINSFAGKTLDKTKI